MPKTDVAVELFYSDAWHDITSDVYTRDAITITRGRPDESSRIPPSSLNLTLDNRDGKFSPRNPMSPLFGLIGRNTPIRVYISNDNTVTEDFEDASFVFEMTGSGDSFGRSSTRAHAGTWSYKLHAGSGDGFSLLDVAVPVGAQEVSFWYNRNLSSGSPTGIVEVDGVTVVTIGAGAEDTWVSSGAISVVGATTLRFIVEGSPFAIADYYFDDLAFTGGGDLRFVGEVESWPQRWAIKGDAWTPITANGITRRLNAPGTTKPAYSPVRRYVQNSAVTVAYWPMEGYTEQPDVVASAVIGVRDASHVAYTPSIASPLNWQGDSTLPGSGNLPVLESNNTSIAGNSAVVLIDTGTAFGFAFWTRTEVPKGATSHGIDTQAIQSFGATGPYGFAIALTQMPPGSSLASTPADGEVNVRVNLMLGSAISQTVNITDLPFVDGWRHVYARISDSGSDLAVSISIDDEVVGTGTFTGVQLTALQGVSTTHFGQDTTGNEVSRVALGHSVVMVGSTSAMDTAASGMYEAGFGYQDESVSDRITRLCAEDGIEVEIIGDTDDDELLGVQRIAPTLDLLQDAADADGGILYEPRSFLGLAYRNGASLYNQTPVVTLDYSAGDQVAPPLEPVDDTDSTVNDVTVTRLGGAFGRAIVEDGTLGIDSVGRYAQDVTLNLSEDARCVQVANWRAHLGTWDEARYPTVSMDLTTLAGSANPDLAEDAATLDIGDRLSIENPPAWLPQESIEQLAQGFTETIESHRWLIKANTTPALPYEVFVVETGTDNRSRIPAGDTTTNEALDTTETGVDIISALVRWIDSATYSSMFPIQIMIGGEQMSVSAITGTGLSQTMTVTRSVNGVVKTHSTGTAVQILRPAVIAL